MSGPAPIFREIHRLRRFTRDLQEQLDRIPRQRKALQARLAKQEQNLREAQDALKHLKVTASDKEKALKSMHEKIARFERQINDVSGKKEYDALQLEISHAKGECSRLEDEILTAIGESEERAAKLPELEKAVKLVKEEIAKFEATIAPRKSDLEAQCGEAMKQLKDVEESIPDDLRSQYIRTVASLGADGLAAVRDRTCENCCTEITVQAYNELAQEKYVSCRSCGRILYLPESTARPSDEGE